MAPDNKMLQIRVPSSPSRLSAVSDDSDEDEGILGFSFPWSISWYFTITGSEYFHIYLWIAKDLAWTQEWRICSMAFGILALCWYIIPAFHALRTRNYDEIWCVIGGFLWLFANFWWMSGEAHDAEFPNRKPISYVRTQQSSHILEAALLWLGFYYLVAIPLELFPVPEKALKEYDDGEFKPRFSYFRNFRQYENVHTLFWLAKDLAWNENNISLWFLFLIPTIGASADLFIIAMEGKNTIIDMAHYASTVIWVLGNIVWAFGEFFYDEHDSAIHLFQRSKESLITARWYSSWILVSAYLPIIIVYSVWIPLTLSGRWNETSDEAIFGKTSISPKSKSYGTESIKGIGSGIDEVDIHLREESEADFFLGGSLSNSRTRV